MTKNKFFIYCSNGLLDHGCVQLVDRILFDYSYAPFRVQTKKLRSLEGEGRKKRHVNVNP